MVKTKDTQFCVKNLKMKRKEKIKFLTFRNRDSNPRFSVIFPPEIWIFMEGGGDEIKLGKEVKISRLYLKLRFVSNTF